MAVSLNEARVAKARARDELERVVDPDSIASVGIERLSDGYGLKINLRTKPESKPSLPSAITGVPVRFAYVGKIKALAAV